MNDEQLIEEMEKYDLRLSMIEEKIITYIGNKKEKENDKQ